MTEKKEKVVDIKEPSHIRGVLYAALSFIKDEGHLDLVSARERIENALEELKKYRDYIEILRTIQSHEERVTKLEERVHKTQDRDKGGSPP